MCIFLPGALSCKGMDFVGTHVYHLIKAIMAEFNHRFSGIDPDQLELFMLVGSSRTPMDSMQTLSETGVHSGSTLVVEVKVQAFPVPRSGA